MWYHSSFLWSIVSMAAYLQAKASAQAANRTLYDLQAVDSPTPRKANPELYEEMLAEPTLDKTGMLPALRLFHMGMRMKMAQHIYPPWVVQDTGVTVVDLQLGPRERPQDDASCECLLG